LAAAVMHAGWNVLVKLKLDRFLSLCLIQTIMGVMGVAMLLVFPLPSLASLPYAVASGVLHLGYNLFLARSYRTGDLSQVYPIARGAAPLLTLAVTWTFMHEDLTLMGGAGVAILVIGIWMISLLGHRGVRLDGLTLFFAIGTSVFIAAYTIVDGMGGRASGQPSSYAGMVFLFDAIFLAATAVSLRGPSIVREVAPYWKTGVVGAALSVGAYWIVIWAMTKAPIASVAALRETSILIVMLLSMRVLKETVSLPRLAGAVLIVIGAVLIRLA
ncbi:MAG: EamA family transporter, partial [Aestuariivirga sp.]|uniref:EamA family transporter n=1 Tax=Aestuariivirga sp. TaxID=2650926 RepID=UPI00301875E7